MNEMRDVVHCFSLLVMHSKVSSCTSKKPFETYHYYTFCYDQGGYARTCMDIYRDLILVHEYSKEKSAERKDPGIHHLSRSPPHQMRVEACVKGSPCYPSITPLHHPYP